MNLLCADWSCYDDERHKLIGGADRCHERLTSVSDAKSAVTVGERITEEVTTVSLGC